MSLIEIKHLRKEYAKVTPLTDVNLTIDKGEVVSIVGASGSGKSTLLRCINRLETPTSGQIIVDGQDMCAPDVDLPKMRQKMGMVFQTFDLFDYLLVVENLMLAPMDLLRLSKQEAYDRAMRLLDTVGLKDMALAMPEELSGGQRQRVAIARALAMEPQIMLFDEPTSALDPQMVSEVLNVMINLASRGLTMAVVTHEMRFARDASTKVVFLNQGECWEVGPPKQVLGEPKRKETYDFIFRVKSWEWIIRTINNDNPAMMASLMEYCAHQFMGRKAVNACQLVVEEVVINQLMVIARKRGLSDPGMVVNLEGGERGVGMVLSVDYRGPLLEGGNPFDEVHDDFSRAIVYGVCESVDHSEPGLARFHIRS